MAFRSDPQTKQAYQALTEVTDFDPATAKALAEAGTVVTVPARWSVIFEHTPADKAYIVLDGEVEIRKSGETVATLGPGSVIGEIALVKRQLRSASVVATTRITALHFTDEAVEGLIEKNPAFADALDAAADERLAES